MSHKKTTIAAQSLVSIGMPTYNRPQELRIALQGIVDQSYQNLEIIVSDNATPNSEVEKVVQEFMENDNRIQYYRQARNLGPLQNFQFVLDKANGEFFMWAADDDWRSENYIERLSQGLMKHPDASIAFCDFSEVDPYGAPRQGQPDHYSLLNSFTTSANWLRQWRFFMQDENLGKANIIYGLMRRRDLADFEWSAFATRHGDFALDMFFVFSMLRRGKMILVRDKLYACTVGNVKYYTDDAHRNLSLLFEKTKKYLRYVTQYVLLASGGARLIILLSLPIKIMKIMIMLLKSKLRDT